MLSERFLRHWAVGVEPGEGREQDELDVGEPERLECRSLGGLPAVCHLPEQQPRALVGGCVLGIEWLAHLTSLTVPFTRRRRSRRLDQRDELVEVGLDCLAEAAPEDALPGERERAVDRDRDLDVATTLAWCNDVVEGQAGAEEQ